MTTSCGRWIKLACAAALTVILSAGCSAAPATRDSAGTHVQAILERYPELQGKKAETERVERVVDGDTFETKSGKVRLIGVNTPEITGGKNEPYGEEARRFTEARLKGRTVYMFQDAGATDRYGRLLRYVFVEDDTRMFNEVLVAEGYANVMTVPPNVMYAERFVELERQARESNKGLWGWDGGGNNGAAGKSAVPQTGGAACDAPAIKGNINANKEKIYHVPGSRSYDRTVPEQWFCTEEEAVAAGFRKAGG
ncbi:thermonuclease family protein [Paenibacillus thermoaerophilus]|uniref:Thermonuclease family protein n=1 Tax=Paenibacillus thermoaerophilus TaxID=1215385 RepID=A0ABW2V1S7_9BACL|nr:thermonuclease family protein [Paenibacillus thermoaerophilus]